MKKFIILPVILLLFVNVNAEHRKINYCQLDKFFDCMVYPLARFTHQTNGTGIPKDDQEFQELCG